MHDSDETKRPVEGGPGGQPPVVPRLSAEQRRELLERGQEVRRKLQERLKPLLEVEEAKLNRRLG